MFVHISKELRRMLLDKIQPENKERLSKELKWILYENTFHLLKSDDLLEAQKKAEEICASIADDSISWDDFVKLVGNLRKAVDPLVKQEKVKTEAAERKAEAAEHKAEAAEHKAEAAERKAEAAEHEAVQERAQREVEQKRSAELERKVAALEAQLLAGSDAGVLRLVPTADVAQMATPISATAVQRPIRRAAKLATLPQQQVIGTTPIGELQKRVRQRDDSMGGSSKAAMVAVAPPSKRQPPATRV